jgi:hypothetical protein
MGYDITFHPFSVDELKYYVFDVAKDPGIAVKRVTEITSNPQKQEIIMEDIYSRFESFFTGVLRNEEKYAKTFAFAAAAIAGYLHPFWYSRGCSISFLVSEEYDYQHQVIGYEKVFSKYIKSTMEIKPDVFEGCTDENSGLILENYSGGSYFYADELEMLWNDMTHEKNQEIVSRVFDESGLEAIGHAINYCRKNNIGFMEATDVVIPITSTTHTDYDNMRAAYLENIDDMQNVNRIK